MPVKSEKKYAIVDQADNCGLIKQIVSILEDDYIMKKVSPKEADYVFHFIKGTKILKTNGIRIFITGENVSPDFNISDYALGFDYIDYLDRYVRIPLYYFYDDAYKSLLKPRQNPDQIFAKKKEFCSYVMSNIKNSAPERETIYNHISSYKKINNGGRWNNNVGGPVINKIHFQKKHKFALAIENSSSKGYCTEKFAEVAQSNCVPIYWGDPTIASQFNPKSFINAHDFSSMSELKEAVIEVDQNDEKYLSMLNEPWMINNHEASISLHDKLYSFLRNIFDQPIETAYRRNRSRWGKKYIKRRIKKWSI